MYRKGSLERLRFLLLSVTPTGLDEHISLLQNLFITNPARFITQALLYTLGICNFRKIDRFQGKRVYFLLPVTNTIAYYLIHTLRVH
jgi:hypothetical protein